MFKLLVTWLILVLSGVALAAQRGEPSVQQERRAALRAAVLERPNDARRSGTQTVSVRQLTVSQRQELRQQLRQQHTEAFRRHP